MREKNNKRKYRILLLSIMGLLLLVFPVFADETMPSIINKQINILDLDQSERMIEEIKSETPNPYLHQFSIKETMLNAINGKQNIRPTGIINGLVTLVFGEINVYFALMGKLMILAILCTVLSTLSASFQTKSTSQIAFYVCYIVLIITLTESFLISMEIAQTTIDQMTMIMHASVPVMITLLISTGNITTGSIFHPIVISSIQIASLILRNMVLPLVFFASVLEIVSHMSEDFKITKLVDLVYLAIKWVLRGIVILFIGVMTMYGLTAPL